MKYGVVKLFLFEIQTLKMELQHLFEKHFWCPSNQGYYGPSHVLSRSFTQSPFVLLK